jgi:DNA-binding response OmpR family regulator
MRVLLVEDHIALRDLISDHLCERGFAVDAVSRAEDALVSIAAISYDAAIIDLGLPEMDGLELLTRMAPASASSPSGSSMAYSSGRRTSTRVGR